MEKVIIGIDPGKQGAMAAILPNGVVADKMPETPMDIYKSLLCLKEGCQTNGWEIVCYLEKVQGIPGNGANSMFTFGQGYGWLEMALIANEIPTVTVTPQKWEKHYQLGSKKDAGGYRQWKKKLYAKAQQLFPELGKKELNQDTADALLIARYGKDMEK